MLSADTLPTNDRDFDLNLLNLINVVFYRPQGKVMFSEASVCWRGVCFRRGICLQQGGLPLKQGLPPKGGLPLKVRVSLEGGRGVCLQGGLLIYPVVTSSGGHYGGQCASYWNAFLCSICICGQIFVSSLLIKFLEIVNWGVLCMMWYYSC